MSMEGIRAITCIINLCLEERVELSLIKNNLSIKTYFKSKNVF